MTALWLLGLLSLGLLAGAFDLIFDDDDEEENDGAEPAVLVDPSPDDPPDDAGEAPVPVTATLTLADGTTQELSTDAEGFLGEIDLSDPRSSLDFDIEGEGFIHLRYYEDQDALNEATNVTGTLQVYLSDSPVPDPAIPEDPADRRIFFDPEPQDAQLIAELYLGAGSEQWGEIYGGPFQEELSTYQPSGYGHLYNDEPDISFDLPVATQTITLQDIGNFGFTDPIPFEPESFEVSVTDPEEFRTQTAFDVTEIRLHDPDETIAIEFEEDVTGYVHLVDFNSWPVVAQFVPPDGVYPGNWPGQTAVAEIGQEAPYILAQQQYFGGEVGDIGVILSDSADPPFELDADGNLVLRDGVELNNLIIADGFALPPSDVEVNRPVTLHTYGSLIDALEDPVDPPAEDPLEIPQLALTLTSANGTPETLNLSPGDTEIRLDMSDPETTLELSFEEPAEGYLHIVRGYTEYEGAAQTSWDYELMVFYSEDAELPERVQGVAEVEPPEPYYIQDEAVRLATIRLGGGQFAISDLQRYPEEHFIRDDRAVNDDPQIISNLEIATDVVSVGDYWPGTGLGTSELPPVGPQEFQATVTGPGDGGEVQTNWDPPLVVLRDIDDEVSIEFEEDFDRYLHIVDGRGLPFLYDFLDDITGRNELAGLDGPAPGAGFLVASDSPDLPIVLIDGEWQAVEGAEALTWFLAEPGIFDPASIVINRPVTVHSYTSLTAIV